MDNFKESYFEMVISTYCLFFQLLNVCMALILQLIVFFFQHKLRYDNTCSVSGLFK